MFFSSDGWGGLGGLDIYKASPLPGDTTGTKFEKPINLGKAYNSSRDDFSFIANDNYTEGYFASNKEGSKGGDDIYHLIWENNLLNLNFINEKDSSIVPNFRFLLKSENSNYLSISKKSNNLGQIQLKANPNTNYKMESLDEKWTIQNTNLSTGKNGNTTEITIKLIEKVIPLIEPNTIKP
ncbi:MAG: hypothetical protein IPP53_00995 [Bacteroidetes bacterium]|nr:hypothetical protein [Bacteroidota bacterium]